jgi:hypothetical protein
VRLARNASYKTPSIVRIPVASLIAGRVGKGRQIASAGCVGDPKRKEGQSVAPNLKIDSRAAALGAHFALDKESDPVPGSSRAENRLKLQNEKSLLKDRSNFENQIPTTNDATVE